MGVTDSYVTKEIISALCWQYTELYNITILQSIYLLKKNEKLFTFLENINQLWWKSRVKLICRVRNKERGFNHFFSPPQLLYSSQSL
jgi:hypothetical protein